MKLRFECWSVRDLQMVSDINTKVGHENPSFDNEESHEGKIVTGEKSAKNEERGTLNLELAKGAAAAVAAAAKHTLQCGKAALQPS